MGGQPVNPREQPSDKSYTIAVCLSAIFGVMGIQHFYLGRLIEATIDLGLFIATLYFFLTGQILLAVLVGAIDAIHTFIVTIMLLTGSFRDGRGRLVLYPGQKLKTGDAI
jgi:TM2 domain-containing membrane protein YozV